MKKKYIMPELEAIKLNMHNSILAGSIKTPGEGYNPSDPSYRREDNGYDW